MLRLSTALLRPVCLFYVIFVFYTFLINAHPHVKPSGLKDKLTIATRETVESATAEPVEEGKVESYAGAFFSECNHIDAYISFVF